MSYFNILLKTNLIEKNLETLSSFFYSFSKKYIDCSNNQKQTSREKKTLRES